MGPVQPVPGARNHHLPRLLDAAGPAGDMTDEDAAQLAAEAKREVRSRRR